MVGKGMAKNIGYGAFGKSQEVQRYDLPSDWKNTVSNLCLRTNFEPAELADLFQTFRQLAGETSRRATVGSCSFASLSRDTPFVAFGCWCSMLLL